MALVGGGGGAPLPGVLLALRGGGGPSPLVRIGGGGGFDDGVLNPFLG